MSKLLTEEEIALITGGRGLKLLTGEEIRTITKWIPVETEEYVSREEVANLAHTALVALRVAKDYSDEYCWDSRAFGASCTPETDCLLCHLERAELLIKAERELAGEVER